MRHRLLVVGCVVAAAAAAVVAFVVVRDEDGRDSRLARAVALAPASTQRFSWTDWAAVRSELDADLSAASSTRDLQRFLDAGWSADLTAGSILVDSAAPLHEEYGVSPATVSWELFTQGEDGALLLLGLADDIDLDALAGRLTELGYTEPEDPDGVWATDPGTLAQAGVTPELTYLTIDEEARVLAASDTEGYVADRHEVERGDTDDGVSSAIAAIGEPLSASVLLGDFACADLAMTQADSTDRVRASQLIEEAGEVAPYRGYAIALLPGGDLRVTMAFETEEQARTNADSRARLLSGPAPGQGGSFSDRFAVDEVSADGLVVTMDLDPVDGGFPLSDLSTGPVLFATC